MNLEGRKVLVAGLGRSGIAAIELLLAQSARPVATDSKDLSATAEKLGVPFLPQSIETFTSADLIVLSPGVPIDLPEVEAARSRAIPIIGEVELASFFLRGPVIGITGANGKTTTTALTGHLLHHSGIPCQVGGNIGLPPTAMIGSSREDQWNVLELSSFQLETIHNFHARIGACLNITPDHLDRHHTFEAYAASKRRLFYTQQNDDFAILNADDPATAAIAPLIPAQPVWFSLSRTLDSGFWLHGADLLCDGSFFMPSKEIPLRGRHNIENVMAGAAAARLAGASIESIRSAVRTFPGVEHRIEFVRTHKGVHYFNDSKATNVDAALKAIDAFEDGLWIILGGKDKGSDYTPLAGPLHRKARAALLIGAAADKISSQLTGSVPLVSCGTLERAVEHAAASAAPGDTVLLAPACASFDQFQNYEERGRTFKTFVANIV